MKSRMFTFIIVFMLVIFSDHSYSDANEMIEVVAYSDLDNYWIVKRRGKPRFEQAQKSKGGCVAVAMVITSDGKTSAHKVVGAFPDHALDEIAVNAWKRTRYEPAENNLGKKHVYTAVTNGYFGVEKIKVTDEEQQLAIKIGDICRRKAYEYLAKLAQE